MQIIVLLALNDEGAPAYDHQMLNSYQILVFSLLHAHLIKFPDLMATALSKQDVTQWAAKEDIALKK